MGARTGVLLVSSLLVILTTTASFFNGKGETLLNYAEEVDLWGRVANPEPIRRASALVLHMDPVAREVCMGAGNDRIMALEGAQRPSCNSSMILSPRMLSPPPLSFFSL